MELRKMGTALLILLASTLAGCGGSDDDDSSADTNPQTTPEQTVEDYSELSGAYAVFSSELENGELEGESGLIVTPSGVALLFVNTENVSFRGIGQLSGPASDFESGFDVFDEEYNYVDTVKIQGGLTKSSTQTTFMIESNQLTETYPMMYATEVTDIDPVDEVLSKEWMVREEYSDQIYDLETGNATISFKDGLGCSYSGELSPSPGSAFVSDEELDLSSYEFIGTIENCTQTSFIGFMSHITINTPAGEMTLMNIMIQNEDSFIEVAFE